jgi:hypothetical protein
MRRHRRCVRKALILRLAEAWQRKRRREDLVRCRPLPHHCIRRAVSDCARVCVCAATVIEGSGCGKTDMAVAKTNSVDTTGAVRVEPQRGRSVAVCQLTTMGTSAPNANPSATP